MPRSHRLTHCTRSISVSLFLQYALMVSLVGLPDPRPARAQTPAQTGDQNTAVRKGSEELPEGKVPRPANAENDSSPKDEPSTRNSEQEGASDLTKRALSGWDKEIGIEKLPNVAGLIKDLQGRKFSTLGSSLLSAGKGFETASAALRNRTELEGFCHGAKLFS